MDRLHTRQTVPAPPARLQTGGLLESASKLTETRMEERRPFSANINQAPRQKLRGDRGESIRLVDQENGPASNVDLHVNYLAPGSGPGPAHFHEHAENVYVVLEGCLEVSVAGELHQLETDDVLFIPPGVVHQTSNPGEVTARFIEVYAPAGDDFHIVEQERAR